MQAKTGSFLCLLLIRLNRLSSLTISWCLRVHQLSWWPPPGSPQFINPPTTVSIHQCSSPWLCFIPWGKDTLPHASNKKHMQQVQDWQCPQCPGSWSTQTPGVKTPNQQVSKGGGYTLSLSFWGQKQYNRFCSSTNRKKLRTGSEHLINPQDC